MFHNLIYMLVTKNYKLQDLWVNITLLIGIIIVLLLLKYYNNLYPIANILLMSFFWYAYIKEISSSLDKTANNSEK
jgi:hypothetical protein